MLPAGLVQEFKRFARDHDSLDAKNHTAFSTVASPTFSSLCSRDVASSAASYTFDAHAVSLEEGISYYAGLPSQPALIYRTGQEKWSAPKGLEAYRRLKELLPVFVHPITRVWNDDLGWKVVNIVDTHKVRQHSYDHGRPCHSRYRRCYRHLQTY